MVVFDDSGDAQDVRDAADAKVTTLMDYFELNKRDPQARQYHYYDIILCMGQDGEASPLEASSPGPPYRHPFTDDYWTHV